MSKHIREGDKVVAIAGNNRGKSGKVLKKVGDKAIVEGLNLRKKHVKRTQQGQGQIIEREMPIHSSNLRIVSDEGIPVKLRVRFNAQNEKELYYLVDDKQVLYRSVKKQK
jgi:large subunit ribosomal protein L24